MHGRVSASWGCDSSPVDLVGSESAPLSGGMNAKLSLHTAQSWLSSGSKQGDKSSGEMIECRNVLPGVRTVRGQLEIMSSGTGTGAEWLDSMSCVMIWSRAENDEVSE